MASCMVKRNPGRRNGSPIPAVLNVRLAEVYCIAMQRSALFLVFVSCGKPCAVDKLKPAAIPGGAPLRFPKAPFPSPPGFLEEGKGVGLYGCLSSQAEMIRCDTGKAKESRAADTAASSDWVGPQAGPAAQETLLAANGKSTGAQESTGAPGPEHEHEREGSTPF
ncbi:hypothetical protein LA080_005289 [Diaporthe eres]|nr:hypothetical protein LA080_005289 [Diaporthe eres]